MILHDLLYCFNSCLFNFNEPLVLIFNRSYHCDSSDYISHFCSDVAFVLYILQHVHKYATYMLFLDEILQNKRNIWVNQLSQGSRADTLNNFLALLTRNILKYMETILSTRIKATRLKHLYSSLKLIGYHYHFILLISLRENFMALRDPS